MLLLAARDSLPAPTAEAIRSIGPEPIVVLGGIGAVSEAVERELADLGAGDVSRLAGADRYATAAAVTAAAFDATVDVAYVATGASFGDALAATPAAAADGAPLLLTDPVALPAETRTELQRLAPSRIVVIGGTAAVGVEVEEELATLLWRSRVHAGFRDASHSDVALGDGWDPPRPGWRCGECQFDHDAVDLASTGDQVRAVARRFAAPLTRGLRDEDLDVIVRARPAPEVWSALEYACHVRDVLDLNVSRIGRALQEDRPEVEAMRRVEVVAERGYNEQERAAVLAEIEVAAEALAALLASVGSDGWDRVVVRDGEELTVAWMARNVVHECDHHLLDVGRALRAARGR